MSRARASSRIPLVQQPEVDPVSYYKSVAPLMLKLLAGRRISVIWQRGSRVGQTCYVRTKSGERKIIQVQDVDVLLRLARQGVIDVLFSLNMINERVQDIYVVDVKADRHVWTHEKSWLILDLVVQIIENFFQFLHLKSRLVYFNGINGFKVIAALDVGKLREYDASVIRRCFESSISLLNELCRRVLKRFKSVVGDVADLMRHVHVSGNTMLKSNFCRSPLSLHWSTKLSAVPVIASVKEFSVLHAMPSIVLSKLHVYANALESRLRRNDIDGLLRAERWAIGDDLVLYEAKSYVLSNITLDS